MNLTIIINMKYYASAFNIEEAPMTYKSKSSLFHLFRSFSIYGQVTNKIYDKFMSQYSCFSIISTDAELHNPYSSSVIYFIIYIIFNLMLFESHLYQ